jgi:TRAP-type C4-dicarboxylate transport system permease small subunit
MLFTSLSFLLFIATTFVLYYSIPPRFQKRLQWIVLLIASVFFYYLTGVGNLIYLGATIVTSYGAANLIARLNAATKPTGLDKTQAKAFKKTIKNKKLIILTACLLVNFGLLGFVKISETMNPDFLRILGISA